MHVNILREGCCFGALSIDERNRQFANVFALTKVAHGEVGFESLAGNCFSHADVVDVQVGWCEHWSDIEFAFAVACNHHFGDCTFHEVQRFPVLVFVVLVEGRCDERLSVFDVAGDVWPALAVDAGVAVCVGVVGVRA